MAASQNRKLWWGMLGSREAFDELSSWNYRHVVNGQVNLYDTVNIERTSHLQSWICSWWYGKMSSFVFRMFNILYTVHRRGVLQWASLAAPNILGPYMETMTILSILGWVPPWVFLACRARVALCHAPWSFGIHEAMTLRLEYLFAIGKPRMLGSKNEIHGWNSSIFADPTSCTAGFRMYVHTDFGPICQELGLRIFCFWKHN